MLPLTPSKKALTGDMRSALDASNAYRDCIVPEDLHTALQNIGSRVRKSVLEGFNTQHLTTFTVPATPFPSPAKLTNKQTTPTPIFHSANDALNSVFPSDSLRVLLTPSPKKRPRAEFDHIEGNSPRIQDKDVDMDMDMDAGSEVEGNQLRSAASFTTPRKIKPLRRSVAQSRTRDTFSDPFISSQDLDSTTFQIVAQSRMLEMDLPEEANV